MDRFIVGILFFIISMGSAQAQGQGAQEDYSVLASLSRGLDPNACSKSPDGWWGHCCVEHDIDYWIGGTYASRIDSDQRLKQCMQEVQAPGFVYFIAVRFFGFRAWGRGWSPRRGYKEFDDEELLEIDYLMDDFRKTAKYKKYYEDYVYYHGREPRY